jgi:hypothetical protein
LLVVMCTNPDAYECTFRNFRHRFLDSRMPSSPITAVVTSEGSDALEITDYIWTEADYVNSLLRAGFHSLSSERATAPNSGWLTDETHTAPFLVISARCA